MCLEQQRFMRTEMTEMCLFRPAAGCVVRQTENKPGYETWSEYMKMHNVEVATTIMKIFLQFDKNDGKINSMNFMLRMPCGLQW